MSRALAHDHRTGRAHHDKGIQRPKHKITPRRAEELAARRVCKHCPLTANRADGLCPLCRCRERHGRKSNPCSFCQKKEDS